MKSLKTRSKEKRNKNRDVVVTNDRVVVVGVVVVGVVVPVVEVVVGVVDVVVADEVVADGVDVVAVVNGVEQGVLTQDTSKHPVQTSPVTFRYPLM